MNQLLRIIFLLVLISGCSSKTTKDPGLDNLVSLIEGEFSNKDQVKGDIGFAYLHMANTAIWKDRPGYWIYTEVYSPKKDTFIYTQRILQYERLDSLSFKSTSYTIPNAKKYKRGWQNKSIFNDLTIDSLKVRKGCEVFFHKNTSTIYTGKMHKKSCTSTIKNVNYITTNFVISKNKISVWNRGYNVEGKQVWGKINGPYKYKKEPKD